jgi:Spy/CpxP family protein refolding chaperone
MKWRALTLAAIAVFCFGFAQAGPAIWDNPQVVKKLGLTEDQQQKLENLQVEHRKFAIKNRAEVETVELDLRQLWKADSPDEAKILAKVREVSDLREKRAAGDS